MATSGIPLVDPGHRRAAIPLVGRLASHIETATGERLLCYMVALFALVHALYYLAGVRFMTWTLVDFWQFLDPELLRTRLLESVLYLHTQPPLFNLFLGVVLKAFPQHYGLAFQCIYVTWGLLLYLSLWRLMCVLGIPRWIALMLASAFLVSPSFILYEHQLTYTLPQTLALTLAALFLYEMLVRQQARYGFGLFTMLLVLGGTWATFHLAFFLAVLGALCLLRADLRRTVMLTALIPGLLLLSIYVKNEVLFRKFTASSWLGLKTWQVVTGTEPKEHLEQLVAEGKLPPVALVSPYSPLDRYPASYSRIPGYEQIPALRQVTKSTGYLNPNHLAYIAISDDYLRGFLYMLRHYPMSYVFGSAGGWYFYFRSTAAFGDIGANRDRMRPVDWFYDHLFYGKAGSFAFKGKHYDLYLGLLIGLPLLFFWSLRLVLKGRAGPLSGNQRITLLFLCCVIAFVAVVCNALEKGENNRMRFVTDPLYLVLLGLFLQHTIGRRHARPSTITPSPDRPPAPITMVPGGSGDQMTGLTRGRRR